MRKSEEMREKYDKTALIYDSRYELVQYQKYSVLIPQLLEVNKGKNSIQLVLPDVIFDFGGGSGLFLKYINQFSEYLQNRNWYMNSNNNAILEQKQTDHTDFNIADDLIELFEWVLLSILPLNFLTISESKTMQIFLDIPEIVVADISHEMLVKCYNESKKMKFPENLMATMACDGQFLPLRENKLTSIVSFTALQNLENIDKGLSEFIRTISSGYSPIVFSILKKSITPEIIEEKINNLMENKASFHTVKAAKQKKIIQQYHFEEELQKKKEFFSRYIMKNFGIFEVKMIKNMRIMEDHFFSMINF